MYCRMIANDELEEMWKEVVVAWFNVLSRHFLELRRNYDNLNQDSRCPRRDSNLAPHEYKSEALSFESACLVGHSWIHYWDLSLHHNTYIDS
jgi:hypothetical protein